MKKLFFSFAILLPLLVFSSHPVHISVTNITLSGKIFTVQTKMFKNDFEDAIAKCLKHTINTAQLSKQDIKAIEKYMQTHLYFIVNSKSSNNYKIDKIKFDDTSVYLSFKLKIPQPDGSIILHNSLLTGLFTDQKNLVIIKMKDYEKGFTFTAKNTEIKL